MAPSTSILRGVALRGLRAAVIRIELYSASSVTGMWHCHTHCSDVCSAWSVTVGAATTIDTAVMRHRLRPAVTTLSVVCRIQRNGVLSVVAEYRDTIQSTSHGEHVSVTVYRRLFSLEFDDTFSGLCG